MVSLEGEKPKDRSSEYVEWKMCHHCSPCGPQWGSPPSTESSTRSLGQAGVTASRVQPSLVVVCNPPPKSPAMCTRLSAIGPSPGQVRSAAASGVLSAGSGSRSLAFFSPVTVFPRQVAAAYDPAARQLVLDWQAARLQHRAGDQGRSVHVRGRPGQGDPPPSRPAPGSCTGRFWLSACCLFLTSCSARMSWVRSKSVALNGFVDGMILRDGPTGSYLPQPSWPRARRSVTYTWHRSTQVVAWLTHSAGSSRCDRTNSRQCDRRGQWAGDPGGGRAE
ncbi:hypothetical protein SALBM311S_11387 [Streptomyces alboniger]